MFDVRRPDGSPECGAFPAVAVGCGTAFRRDALREVGGLPDDFFIGAEDLDLSLRLLEARWDVRRFDDARVEHLRTPADRVTMRTTRLDVRNHLLVAAGRLPRAWAVPYAVDWTRRAWWVASKRGKRHQLAAASGIVSGVVRSLVPGRRRPIGLAAFERFASAVDIRRRMERLVASTASNRSRWSTPGRTCCRSTWRPRRAGCGSSRWPTTTSPGGRTAACRS